MTPLLKSVLFLPLAILILASDVIARSQINIVGSSSVYPFATVVAENFGRSSNYSTPKIESTGTGGGIKLFCEKIGVNTPDISNASRRIKQKEIDMCFKNGVTDIIEVKIGYDGIVFANAKDSVSMDVTLKHIFLALAKNVPNPDGSQALIPNPYKTWKDIDTALPNNKIEVLGPPPTSGTRDAFAELALEGGCKTFDWIKAMKKTDKKAYKKVCHTVREDGAYIESGENDNLIVQKLNTNPNAFGVFGFSFLDQNTDVMKASAIDSIKPAFETIADGSYVVSRVLYLYAKKAHIDIIPNIREFLAEFISDRASGNEGYLADRGLIPMSPQERSVVETTLRELKTLPAKITSH